MFKVTPYLAAAAGMLVLTFSCMGSDLEQEYVQVRKIALKDAHVQEAFQKANERLDEKILQIDPALKPIVDREHGNAVETRTATVTKHEPAAAAPKTHRVDRVEYVVAKGDTLTSVAEKYKVTVAGLKKANHITDERKLQVGQKLEIPAAESIETKPAQAEKQDDSGGWWSGIKRDL